MVKTENIVLEIYGKHFQLNRVYTKFDIFFICKTSSLSKLSLSKKNTTFPFSYECLRDSIHRKQCGVRVSFHSYQQETLCWQISWKTYAKRWVAGTPTSISRVKNNWKSMEMNCMTVGYDGVREGNNMSEICYSWSGLALFFWYLYLCVVFIQQIFPQFSCFSSGVFSPHFWCVKQNFSDNFHILIIVVTCWVMAGTDQNIDHHQQHNLSEPPQGLGH